MGRFSCFSLGFVSAMRRGRDLLKNASLDESVAAHTVENREKSSSIKWAIKLTIACARPFFKDKRDFY